MNWITRDELLAFEARIRDIFAEGELPYLVHLCGGNEEQLIKIFERVQRGDWVFASHRNHYHYLLSGGNPERLEQLIRYGKSMFVYEKATPTGTFYRSHRSQSGSPRRYSYGMPVNFVTSAILGGTAGIAAGVAAASIGYHTWCFLGDGAFDNGHAFEAIMYVEARGLPCTFIIEDNDRSVDTTKEERLGPYWKNPFREFKCVERYHYTPTYPHGGAGLTTMVQFKPSAIERAKKMWTT